MKNLGLNILDVDNRKVILDSDNLFWSILPKPDNGSVNLSRNLLSLYDKFKDNLDKEMYDFRFGLDLSAIYIDPTDKCNANCPYCYVPPKIRKYGRSMTKDELEFILNKIYAYRSGDNGLASDRPEGNGLVSFGQTHSQSHRKGSHKKLVIIFHASEPLLVKDIVFYAIEKFKDKFFFGLQTNALLLKQKDVDFLIKHRVGVGISLDSHDPKVNNRLRSGNFNQIVNALDWFDGYSGLNVITTITKYNVTHLEKIVKFLHAKKVSCVLLNPMRFTQKYALKLKPDEKIMAQQFLKAVDTAIELSRNSGRQIIVANFANIILAIVSPFARRLMCDISPCGGGRCFFTITAKGEMIPCGEFIGLKGFSGGNIFSAKRADNIITQALNSKPFNKIRDRFVENVKECNICDFRNICGSPCPAELHSLDKFRQKSVFCDFYKAITRHAFKLIAEGKEEYILRREIMNNLKYEYKI
ncbi:MAG: peptide-modifying radical SAM enzyme CbpB [Candidatus Omnitrophota bacterium]|nr:peptide-modifying radical SAM enzyme CbpB [Candidatus Omnitrophota bacterium]